MENNKKKWTTEDRKRVGIQREKFSELMHECRLRNDDPVVFDVNFKTGEYVTYDSSNLEPFVQKVLPQKERKKAA